MAGRTNTQVRGGPADPVLAEVLSGWPDERLVALLSARPDLTSPPPRTLAELASRAASPASLWPCYLQLDLFALQLADAVCLLDGPVTVDALVALLGEPADAAAVAEGLARLEDLALVVSAGKRLHVVQALRDRPYPGGLGPPAAAVLGRPGSADPGTIARNLGVAPGRSRAATVAAVASALADPRVVLAALEGHPKGTLDLVDELARSGAVQAGPIYQTTDRTPVGWLVLRGLAVTVSWSTLVMPREVGLALRGGRAFQPQPSRPAVAGAPVDAATTDAAAAEAALRLVADVAAVLDSLAEVPARILKAGGLGVRDVRRLAKVLGRPEAETAQVLELAAVAGLATADPLTGTALPVAAYDEWLALDGPGRWAWLVERWLAADLHLSLAGALDTKQKPIPPLLLRGGELDAAPRRRLVLGVLAEAGPGRSADRDGVVARVTWERPSLWAGGPARPSTLIEWVLSEAELLGVSATRSLATAGRLAVDGRSAEARAALAERAPAQVSSFVVQADFSAMAPGELAPPLRSELELLADVESTGAATVFRFSEASLSRALAAGRDAPGILAFLEAHATRGVPQPLAYLIEDLGRRYGRVRVGPARCYVRSDDPSLLAEVVRARRTGALGLRLLAPTVAVGSAEAAVVVAALGEGGFLAAEEDAGGGLVLQRRPVNRAAPVTIPGPRRRPALPRRSSPAEVVAALRRAPAPPPSGWPEPAVAPLGPPELRLLPEAWGGNGLGGLEDDDFLDFPDEDDELDPVCGCAECRNANRDVSAGARARPTAIAHGPAAAELLALACDEEWVVRLGYENGRGQLVERNVAVMGLDGDAAFVERLPRWTAETLVLERVRWARVLTDAEEMVMFG